MAENMDDAIIEVVEAIRKQYGPKLPQEFAVLFTELDKNWTMPPGQTASCIDAAAADLGYEITRRGETRANLRRKLVIV